MSRHFGDTLEFIQRFLVWSDKNVLLFITTVVLNPTFSIDAVRFSISRRTPTCWGSGCLWTSSLSC